jgi:hypothetical protein
VLLSDRTSKEVRVARVTERRGDTGPRPVRGSHRADGLDAGRAISSHDEDPRATSEVVASVVANSQALVRKELELAKLEVKRIATEKAMAVGLALAGAVLGLFILAFVGVTAAKALELVVAEWLAWLIVTLIYTLLAGIALAVAMRYAKRPATPERTKAAADDTVEWAKRQAKR